MDYNLRFHRFYDSDLALPVKFLLFLGLLFSGLGLVPSLAVASGAEMLEVVRAANTRAAVAVQKQDLESAAVAIRESIAALTEAIHGDPPASDTDVKPLKEQLTRVHAMIELGGMRLPPLRLIPLQAIDEPQGPDPSMPNQSMPTMETSTMETPIAKDPDTPISFALDVAPLLAKHCSGCHVATENPRGEFDMNSFALLLDHGEAVQSGAGDDSSIVRRMRGMDGNRMPAGGRPAVPEPEIALIAKWIDQGATFDGSDPNQTLADLGRTAFLSMSTPDEITARRIEMANDQWKLSNPSVTPEKLETKTVVVIGSGSKGSFQSIAEMADLHLQTAKTLLSVKGDAPLFAGKPVVLVFSKRYDYGEFVQMVLQRRAEPDALAHWTVRGAEANVAIVVASEDADEIINDRLSGPLLSLAVASRGDVPRWFADGVGTAASMRRIRDRGMRNKIQTETLQAWAAMPSTEAFLKGQMSPQRTEAIGAAVASAMVTGSMRRSFDVMIRSLVAGQSFEDSFATAYNVPIDDFIQRLRGNAG